MLKLLVVLTTLTYNAISVLQIYINNLLNILWHILEG